MTVPLPRTGLWFGLHVDIADQFPSGTRKGTEFVECPEILMEDSVPTVIGFVQARMRGCGEYSIL